VRILPLVLHAAARIPALTDLFSDRMQVTSMTVEVSAKVTFTTTVPHGVPMGTRSALSVVDADTPNPITAVVANSDRSVTLTTQYEHDISTVWHPTVKLTGFPDAHMNGPLQLVRVDGLKQFTVLPGHAITSITLTGSEQLLERLEDGIIGWHAVIADSPTTLTFDTPTEVTRFYTVASPIVVSNIRVAGALSLEVAQASYLATEIGDRRNAWVFICPPQVSRLSRDRNSRSDAVAEMSAGGDYRQLLIDGFFVFVFLPSEGSKDGVTVSDQAHGGILAALLRTFHGLSLPRSELWQGDAFVAYLTEHGNMLGSYNKATYVHGYSFEAPAYLLQQDAIQPFEWSAINETRMTASSGVGPGTSGGAVLPTDPLPVGSVAFRGITLGNPGGGAPPKEGTGFTHDDAPGSLTAFIPLT
jgi:hypothetical protein